MNKELCIEVGKWNNSNLYACSAFKVYLFKAQFVRMLPALTQKSA
jgi:hypothetical protein